MDEVLGLFHQINAGAIGWGVIIAAILSIIQIAPIRINPWSFIARHLGRALNRDTFARLDRNEERLIEVRQDVDDLLEHIDHIEDKIGENEAKTARARIIKFNNELLEQKRHTKDAFDEVLEYVDYYDKYCDAHPEFKNSITKMSQANIIANYEKRLKKHDFLTPNEVQ